MQKQEIVEKALANFSDPFRRDQYFELYAPEIVLHGYGMVEPGKAIQLTGMTILRFREQRCVERWSVTDSLSLAIQLGVFSLPK